MLIHGSWHAAWCWDEVVPLLEQAGHRVEAPDLPGHGADVTPPGEVTLASYVERVCDVLDRQDEPVVLVGHSHGGIVVTQVAEERPDRVAMLVYLCAYLPRDGESLVQLAQRDPDPERNVLRHVEFHPDGGFATVSARPPRRPSTATAPRRPPRAPSRGSGPSRSRHRGSPCASPRRASAGCPAHTSAR